MKGLSKMHFPLAVAIFMTLLLATSCIYGYAPAATPTQPYQSPPVTPAPSAPYQAPQSVINSFNASPSMIEMGQSATLSWTVTGADTVRIDPNIGPTATSGSQIVSPYTTTTYILTATGPGGVVTETTVVSVVPAQTLAPYSQYPGYPVYPAVPSACAPAIQYFEINPPVVSPGETAVMSWNVTNASSVTIDQGIGPVPAAGSITLLPYYITYYTLTAANTCGTVTAEATVTVYPLGYNYIYPYPSGFFPSFVPGENEEFNENEFGERNETQTQERQESHQTITPPPTMHNFPDRGNLPRINDFQTTPPHIQMGNQAQIKWNVSGASSVNISPGIGEVGPSGTMNVKPDQTTNYKITARNSAGVVEHSSQIIVPRTFEGGQNYGGGK